MIYKKEQYQFEQYQFDGLECWVYKDDQDFDANSKAKPFYFHWMVEIALRNWSRKSPMILR